MTAPVVAQNNKVKGISEDIAMTAPVVSTSEGESHMISFVMPRSYTLETLPTPNDPRVKIVMIPTKKYAVMKFSWYRSDVRIKSMQEKLLEALNLDSGQLQINREPLDLNQQLQDLLKAYTTRSESTGIKLLWQPFTAKSPYPRTSFHRPVVHFPVCDDKFLAHGIYCL